MEPLKDPYSWTLRDGYLKAPGPESHDSHQCKPKSAGRAAVLTVNGSARSKKDRSGTSRKLAKPGRSGLGHGDVR